MVTALSLRHQAQLPPPLFACAHSGTPSFIKKETKFWHHLPPGLFRIKKHRYFYRCFLTLSGSLTFFNGSCVRGLDQTKSKPLNLRTLNKCSGARIGMKGRCWVIIRQVIHTNYTIPFTTRRDKVTNKGVVVVYFKIIISYVTVLS